MNNVLSAWPISSSGAVEPADLVIGMLGKAGVGLHLACEQLLLVSRQRRPILDVLVFRRELRPSRHDAELDLASEGFFSELVPALIELALVLVAPFGRHVVRRMRRTGCEVHVERLVRAQRFLEFHPRHGLVGHVGREVIFRIFRQLDLRRSVVDQRRILVRLTADEAVEVLEPGMCRPTVVRPGRRDLPRRRFVILAIRRGAVPVLPENFGNRS